MFSCEIIIPLASLSLTEFAAALVITCVCMWLGTGSPFGASWDTPPCSGLSTSLAALSLSASGSHVITVVGLLSKCPVGSCYTNRQGALHGTCFPSTILSLPLETRICMCKRKPYNGEDICG